MRHLGRYSQATPSPSRSNLRLYPGSPVYSGAAPAARTSAQLPYEAYPRDAGGAAGAGATATGACSGSGTEATNGTGAGAGGTYTGVVTGGGVYTGVTTGGGADG